MAEEKSSASLENGAFFHCVLSVLRMILEELVRKQVAT